MNKAAYEQYLESGMWQERRHKHLKNHPRCAKCGIDRDESRRLYHRDLEVHHLNYRNVGNEQPGDLQTLCRRHHIDAGFRDIRVFLESIGVTAEMFDTKEPA